MKLMSVLTIAAPLFLAGCALTTDEMDLAYKSPGTTIAVPGADRVIVAVQTTDSRPGNQRQFSSKKNA
jgi:uncharacterized lipoprotein YajG